MSINADNCPPLLAAIPRPLSLPRFHLGHNSPTQYGVVYPHFKHLILFKHRLHIFVNFNIMQSLARTLRHYRHRISPHHHDSYRPKRRRKRRRRSSPLFPLLLLFSTIIIAGNPLFHRLRIHRHDGTFRPPQLPQSPVQADRTSARVRLDAMRPPQFDEHLPSKLRASSNVLKLLDDSEPKSDFSKKNMDDKSSIGLPFLKPPPISKRNSRDAVANPLHERRPVTKPEENTRTCYHSAHTGGALCVHVPFCIRDSAIVYLADTLRCAAYSNKQGTMATLSMGRCVELERELELAAEMSPVEAKAPKWLDSLEGKILWFEGDTVFVKLGPRAKSVQHFADRIFMLHHVLQHPERYGMGAVANVVIAAHDEVAKKIKYTKSWHHGLLSAMVYPNKLMYSLDAVQQAVRSVPGNPRVMRVFVPSDMWDIAKGKKEKPCFRRAALPGSVKGQFFMTEDVYPGVVDASSRSSTRYRDADVFRTLLFQWLGHQGPPRIKKHILYLHREVTRTLTDEGLKLLKQTVREVAKETGFTCETLNVAGMTFPKQVEAVAGAGVVIGVHGTQMLNTLFLPAGSSVVELFPYRFVNNLFRGGSGAGLSYRHHHVVHGEDFADLWKWGEVEECKRRSRGCRTWYQSDTRRLEFGELDAARVKKLLEEATRDVKKSLGDA